MSAEAQAALSYRGARFAVWLVAVLAMFWLLHAMSFFRGLPLALGIVLPILISLSCAWALGLLGARSSWLLRIAVVLISVTLPYIVIFVLLMGVCPLVNTMAGGYRCGL